MRIAGYLMAILALSLGACSQAGETESASETPQLEGAELAAALADEGLFLLDVREPSELEELGIQASKRPAASVRPR